jgi:hypothetical protein
MSFCSADTLTYEEKRPCNAHAATIAASAAESIRRAVTSCDPEGRSDALVNPWFFSGVGSGNAPCRFRAFPCRLDHGMF